MTYLFAAYGVAWALLFGYLAWVFGRQRALQSEVRMLREYVERRDRAGTPY